MIDQDGYGRMKLRLRCCRAHRLAYEHFVAPIPEGLEIDHLCRVRHCVNPGHMELVDRKTNILRGNGLPARNARKVLCKRGHKLEIKPNRKRPNIRFCRTCKNLSRRKAS